MRDHVARAMLADIYNWFTEDFFDAAEVEDAESLLPEQSARRRFPARAL